MKQIEIENVRFGHKDMPSPSENDLKHNPLFEQIWNVIKTWDINVPEFYEGYCGASGSHVKLIMNGLMDAPDTRKEGE